VERSRFMSHAEVARIMRRAGYSNEEIEDVLRDFPDPVDTERYAGELLKHGLTMANLTDRMGGSP
jgi:hypothetical protein